MNNTLKKHSNGATLIVALVFLLAMSLIALTTLNTATLEEKMAINLQNDLIVFQSGESAISQVLQDEAVYFGVLVDNVPVTKVFAYDSDQDGTDDVRVAVAVESKIDDIDDGATASAMGTGNSLRNGPNDVKPVNFLLTATAVDENNNLIQSKIVQGIKFCPGGC